MKITIEKKYYLDNRGKKLHIGDVVIVRHAFPYTAKLSKGKITSFRYTLHGDLQVKIANHKEWFWNPLKLA
jgi:hypothetical protein